MAGAAGGNGGNGGNGAASVMPGPAGAAVTARPVTPARRVGPAVTAEPAAVRMRRATVGAAAPAVTAEQVAPTPPAVRRATAAPAATAEPSQVTAAVVGPAESAVSAASELTLSSAVPWRPVGPASAARRRGLQVIRRWRYDATGTRRGRAPTPRPASPVVRRRRTGGTGGDRDASGGTGRWWR